jgi:hypothetical protein
VELRGGFVTDTGIGTPASKPHTAKALLESLHEPLRPRLEQPRPILEGL